MSAEDIEIDQALKEMKNQGGLCLVLGAKNDVRAEYLISKYSYYAQVLQPSYQESKKWGDKFASSIHREKIGVRHADFLAENYGSDLFNLILLEDVAALGQVKMVDVFRILVPSGGLIIFQNSTDLQNQARELKMSSISLASGATLYIKPVLPIKWGVCNSIKWRVGPRAQLSGGWRSIYAGDQKFFYRQRMEVPGSLEKSTSQFFARDAFNGSLLWTFEEPEEFTEKDFMAYPIVASEGRVFTTVKDKLVCLDSKNGNLIYNVIPSGLKFRDVLTLKIGGSVLLAHGTIGLKGFSIVDGKELWALKGFHQWANDDRYVYFHMGAELKAVDINDGKTEKWSIKEGDAILSGRLIIKNKYLYIDRGGPNFKGPEVTMIDAETGKTLWSHEPETGPKRRSNWFGIFEDKFLSMTYSAYENREQDLWIDLLNINSGEAIAKDFGPKGADPFNMCAPVVHRVGENYLVYFFNIWIDLKTKIKTFTYLSHPSCFYGNLYEYGYVYNVPSRKAGPLVGISAIGPADIEFNQEPGGKLIKKNQNAKLGEIEPKSSDWPMFCNNAMRSSSISIDIGSKVEKVWEVNLGLPNKNFGIMSGERTGFTQPVIVGDVMIVADMDSQRVLALESNSGKIKWVYHVGSRVEFSPSIYKDLVVFSAKDGWVYCLNLSDGALNYKLLVPPQERFIGGQNKLESLWPMVSDVLVMDGIGYISAGLSFATLGGVRAIAFKIDTGEIVWSKCYHIDKMTSYRGGPFPGMFVAIKTQDGFQLNMSGSSVNIKTGELERKARSLDLFLDVDNMDDYLSGGVSIPRNAEDRGPVGLKDGRIFGKTIAFDKDLSVAYFNERGAETWNNTKNLILHAKNKVGKEILWEIPNNEMTVDSIVLSNKYVYCAGHYARVKKDPELIVLSREDGKILHAVNINGYPSFYGMSIANGKLFVTTRDGKIICFEQKK